MFSYADLRRGEIALALSDWYGLPFADVPVIESWQTVGDVIQYVVARARPPVTDAQALEWVRELFAFGWGIRPTVVAPESQLFGPELRLDCRDFFRDYTPPPRRGDEADPCEAPDRHRM